MKMPNFTTSALGFTHLPLVRQLGLLIGLAASVALGVAVVMWGQEPSYRMLYSSLSDKDSGQIIDALQKNNIPYKVDQGSGAIQVPMERVHDARLKLATQGLPKGTSGGFEAMEGQQGFGTSQFMEAARYQRALEEELALSIATLNNVQGARVHLAIPKQSVFVRTKQEPSASVVVNLYPGRNLSDGEVTAIVHLVASSIPNLSAEQVTVIDQKGELLTSQKSSREMALSASQFEYTQLLEDSYVKRIEGILSPIVGAEGVRAQVVAEMDFTITEQTLESFNKEKPALRSEQTSEEKTVGGGAASGIPGALSNQAPPAATVAPTAANAAAAAAGATAMESSASGPQNSSARATRNYELDKTISHTQLSSGTVKRLSVAVVVNDRQSTDDNGDPVKTPLTPEELTRFTALVKDAVGFNEKRGDTVNVVNASFNVPEAVEPPPEPSFFEQPWLASLGKQLGAGLVVLLIVFGVLRPVLSGLATRGDSVPRGVGAQGGMMVAEDRLSLGGPAQAARLAGPSSYDANLSTAKTLAAQDPKRVAQVVKTWVASDG
jgi:flagellar M-ring protein FliF